MSEKSSYPKTLLEAVTYFSDETRAFETVRDARWPNGVRCPHCDSDKVRYMEMERKQRGDVKGPRRKHTDGKIRAWNCNKCRKQFTLKTGSIFEDSPLPFRVWLSALWFLANQRNGTSSHELARALGIQQRSAWHLNHRLRAAMANGSFEKLCDNVEADETHIGGLARNMHRAKREALRMVDGRRQRSIKGHQTVVVGALERGGEIRLKVVAKNDGPNIHDFIKSNVLKGSNLYTDTNSAYDAMYKWYAHEIVNHAVEYVRDNIVHTNGLENFWSLLKRTMRGTYVSVEPFHLHRYLGEYAFRFNNRRSSDAERFRLALSQVVGKKLSYSELTGREGEMAA